MPGRGWRCVNFAKCKNHTWRRPPKNECATCRGSLRGLHTRPAAALKGSGGEAKRKRPRVGARPAMAKRALQAATRGASRPGAPCNGQDEGLSLKDSMWSKLGELRREYGDASALRILAAALTFLEQLPLYIVPSRVATAALLSIGVALAADALQGKDLEDVGIMGRRNAANTASRAPARRLAGVDKAKAVQTLEARLLSAMFHAMVPSWALVTWNKNPVCSRRCPCAGACAGI